MSNQDDSWWNRKPLTEVNHRTRKILLTTLVVVWGGLLLLGFADEIGGTQSMNINITHIGGWNVWWFIAFWMLSQCILVHHARRK